MRRTSHLSVTVREVACKAVILKWEADERPDPCSLGWLPSGPDPVDEWLVHRQPPATYIGRTKQESKRAERRRVRSSVHRNLDPRCLAWLNQRSPWSTG